MKLAHLANKSWGRALLLNLAVSFVACGQYGESDHTRRTTYKRDLAYRLQRPMAQGLDVTEALEAWFAAETADAGEALQLYLKAMASLEDLAPLPKTTWPPDPADVTLEWRETVPIPDLSRLFGPDDRPAPGIRCRVAEFSVDNLRQYGVVLEPETPGKYPLILYLHGAAFGVPAYSLPWLSRLAARGYVIAAPALRGEPLFASREYLQFDQDYHCEGQIENLDGEVNDALGMVAAVRKLDSVREGDFAILAHSFGAGVGLLVAARSSEVSCVVSYDAWLVNPFRYYWDRLRDGADNWLSWEQYVQARTVPEQLSGLMRRSVVHHAEQIQAPLLLFMGGAYNGSVFHQSHDDLTDRLQALDKTYRYEIIPGGSHNFVLYPGEEPARRAFVIQDSWLEKHHPPAPPVKAP